MVTDAKIRLYVEHPLGPGQSVPLDPDQALYLFSVMRLGPGDGVLLFNGADGEWLATVAEAGKRRGILLCDSQTRPLQPPPDLWLLFSPVKKAETVFIVEKAVAAAGGSGCRTAESRGACPPRPPWPAIRHRPR